MGAAVGEIYRAAARGTIYSQRVMLTHHYIITDIVGSPDYDVVYTQMLSHLGNAAGGSDLWESKLLACMPPSYTLDNFEVQLLRPFRLAYARLDRAQAGTHASDTQATNQAACITLKTAFAGRWAQCNKHIGPIPQAATVQSSGLIVAAFKTKLETLGAALLTPLVTGLFTMQPIIMHPVGAHLGSTPLLTQAIQTTVRVMRRRTVGLGE